MRKRKEMHRLADALIEPLRVPVPADPDVLFDALVDSVNRWRGRPVLVHRRSFPAFLRTTGMWMEQHHPDAGVVDHIVIEKDAADWHKLVIFGHEVWHMHKAQSIGPEQLAAAARTDFVEAAEKEAERFGLLVARRLRPWLRAAPDSVYAARGGASDLAGRIGAALDHRGTQP
ncbi:toxin [Streptomyces sp. NPDC021562]|uniref:toxin n=1 Tax=Streptomyces sp. NPDC021562 TaxID=3155121 RepID=UPI001050D055